MTTPPNPSDALSIGPHTQTPTPSTRIEPFPPTDPKGYIYGAQVEFTYAFQMLEVLLRLSAEGEHAEMLPVEGLHGLFCAIQGHVGAGSNGLHRWQEEHAMQTATKADHSGR